MTGLQRETLFEPPEDPPSPAAESRPRWTKARRAGLLAFAGNGAARESNRTLVRRGNEGLVYWQTRAWLSREGLITLRPGGERYVTSPAGRAELARMLLEPAKIATLLAMYGGGRP